MPYTIDSNGWTTLTPVSGSGDSADDTRFFYVDVDAGSASPSTAYYSPGDATIGDDPRQPDGTPDAYDSLAGAIAQVRDNKPDWVLIKRGTTEQVGYVRPRKNGVSYSAPQVWTSYGSTSDALPKLIGTAAEGSAVFYFIDDEAWYTIIRGIEFYNRTGDPNAAEFDREALVPFGVFSNGGMTGLTIEGCRFNYCGAVCQAYAAETSNFQLRRNVVFHNWANANGTGDTGHVQGLFVAGVYRDDASVVDTYFDMVAPVIEENVFDWNGLQYDNASDDEADAVGTTRNRNMYLINYSDCEIKGNIVFRSASSSIQARAGGTVQNNIVGRGGSGINVGSSELDSSILAATGTVQDN